MDPVTLSTERLALRPFEPSDAEAVRLACQDPEIPRWTPVPSPYTEQDAHRFIASAADNWQTDTAYTFGAFTRDGGDLVGSIGLVRIAALRTPERQAELGYWTAKEQRGRGYTVEAAREVCRWGFADLGVERMEWCAEAGNLPSRAVALKVGFRIEGTHRARIIHAGTRRDAWFGALLPCDLGLPTETPYLPYEAR